MFVATEFALVTVRRSRINQLASEGSRAARRVQVAMGNLDYYIAAAQLGITMASIMLGAVGEPVIASIIEPPIVAFVGSFAPVIAHTVAIAVAFTFVTALHIIIGEFIPKSIALEQAERTAYFITIPVNIFIRVFGPVVWVLNHTSNALFRLIGQDLRPLGDDPLTAEDLAHTFESSASAGLISRRELGLTRQLLRLSGIESQELMVPRSKMVGLNKAATREELAAVFADRPLTRYPVYEDTIDNIVGILDAKRLLLLRNDAEDSAWQVRIQPATIIPETVTAETTLETLRAEDTRMAILVDEYGGIAGLITQFDIVLFLATDLPETLHIDHRHSLPGDSQYPQTLSGLVRVSELREASGLELPESDATTLGGLVTELRNSIPDVGDSVQVDGLTLAVLEMDNYRVARVQVDQHSDDPEPARPDGSKEVSR
ncbi:MAG: HlyC/CorC family transporter [Chloroflexia bacterium]|nr:HlyC/CorC family transporter [Chloroflexia bacterium]